jgi:hypothetical protein
LVSVNEVMAYVGEKKENESEIGFLDWNQKSCKYKIEYTYIVW